MSWKYRALKKTARIGTGVNAIEETQWHISEYYPVTESYTTDDITIYSCESKEDLVASLRRAADDIENSEVISL